MAAIMTYVSISENGSLSMISLIFEQWILLVTLRNTIRGVESIIGCVRTFIEHLDN